MPIPTKPALPFVEEKAGVSGAVTVRLDPRFIVTDESFEDKLVEEMNKLLKTHLTNAALLQIRSIIGSLVEWAFQDGIIVYNDDGPSRKPQLFNNSCQECDYLGRTLTDDADLFYCKTMQNYIVKYGDEPHKMRWPTSEERWICELLEEEKK